MTWQRTQSVQVLMLLTSFDSKTKATLVKNNITGLGEFLMLNVRD